MARKRHTAEEIVAKLRQIDVLLAQSRPVADAVRAIGVTEVSLEQSSHLRTMAREATRNSLFTFIVVFIFCISPAAARGPDGHAIVAQIAQNRLRPEVRSKVSAMLNGESLASVSSWADQIRLNRRETSRWHFINFAEGATDYVPSRDCALVEGQGDCIIAAIERAIANLKQEGANSVDALKFLVHSSAICTNRFTPLRPNAAEMASV